MISDVIKKLKESCKCLILLHCAQYSRPYHIFLYPISSSIWRNVPSVFEKIVLFWVKGYKCILIYIYIIYV